MDIPRGRIITIQLYNKVHNNTININIEWYVQSIIIKSHNYIKLDQHVLWINNSYQTLSQLGVL